MCIWTPNSNFWKSSPPIPPKASIFDLPQPRDPPAASGKDFGRETTVEVLETAKAGEGIWGLMVQYHEGFKSSSLRGLYDYGCMLVCCLCVYKTYIIYR